MEKICMNCRRFDKIGVTLDRETSVGYCPLDKIFTCVDSIDATSNPTIVRTFPMQKVVFGTDNCDKDKFFPKGDDSQ